ncbi:hypothetical protein CVIRNUC_008017 [Coccomyxa viridis]|uniref:NAD(P)-binding domain-containing protein n=1 Tax=Coccomyxa viridis TaxID=1274662 RepID=A0AAV1IFY5_9CHLO|nr:hypothetical protein CVIRNUC_008017 [Coccomyxa viridis]
MRCHGLGARSSVSTPQRLVYSPMAQRLSARQTCRSFRVMAAQLDPDNASILVAGGGGVALAVTRKLKDMGSWVWMLQRSETRRSEIEGMMAILVRGDALKKEDVEKAMGEIEEVDAVVSTIGGTPADPTADSQGNINLIEAAAKKGVKKFVLVTSIGTGDSKDAPPTQVYDVLKPVLLEKEKAEEALKGSPNTGSTMQWTIIRPGGLKSEPATGSGILTEDRSVCGAINREDVADLVVKALFSDKADGKVLAAVDQSQLYGEPKLDVFQL